MNENEKRTEVEELTQLLIRLRPARSQLDSRVVFFDAGFSAGRSQASPHRPRIAPLFAAGLLVAMVIAPASYHVGQSTAMRSVSDKNTEVAMDGSNDFAAEELRADEIRSVEATRSSDMPRQIIEPSVANPSPWFARWLNPLSELDESAKFEPNAAATLAAFHSTRMSREDIDRNRMEFPFSATQRGYRDLPASPGLARSVSTSPLTVCDLQQLAQSLESAR